MSEGTDAVFILGFGIIPWCFGLLLIVLLLTGYFPVKRDVMVEKGYAEYVLNTTNGNSRFVWVDKGASQGRTVK